MQINGEKSYSRYKFRILKFSRDDQNFPEYMIIINLKKLNPLIGELDLDSSTGRSKNSFEKTRREMRVKDTRKR